MIKAQLRRKNLENGRKEELQVQLTLLNTFFSELKDKVKCCKDNLKACQINFAESKKNWQTAEKKEVSQGQVYQWTSNWY